MNTSPSHQRQECFQVFLHEQKNAALHLDDRNVLSLIRWRNELINMITFYLIEEAGFSLELSAFHSLGLPDNETLYDAEKKNIIRLIPDNK